MAEYEILPVSPSVWHVDILREHWANRCAECHTVECFICIQARLIGCGEEESNG